MRGNIRPPHTIIIRLLTANVKRRILGEEPKKWLRGAGNTRTALPSPAENAHELPNQRPPQRPARGLLRRNLGRAVGPYRPHDRGLLHADGGPEAGAAGGRRLPARRAALRGLRHPVRP